MHSAQSIHFCTLFMIKYLLQNHICVKVNVELFSFFLMYKNDSQELKSFGTKNIAIHMNQFLESENGSHFCLIKNLSRLVRSQISKHHQQLHLCESCLLFFNSSIEQVSHLCGGIATVLPEKGSILQFTHYAYLQTKYAL